MSSRNEIRNLKAVTNCELVEILGVGECENCPNYRNCWEVKNDTKREGSKSPL